MKKMAKVGLMFGAIGAIAIFILLSIVVNEGAATSPSIDGQILIDGHYLLKESATNETLNVTCILYLTNRWNKSGDISIVAYVIDSKGLAEYRTSIEVGNIDMDKTEEVSIPIVLRENSRKINILIFEDGLLKMKGYIYVDVFYNSNPYIYKERCDLVKAWNCHVTSSSFPSTPNPIEIARIED